MLLFVIQIVNKCNNVVNMVPKFSGDTKIVTKIGEDRSLSITNGGNESKGSCEGLV